ncbi:MAG: RAMP superfamily CRISPR-associated protein [Chloroflexota bacterium]
MERWRIYRLVFRLEMPLHSGSGALSYLRRTRPYVTARALRGALISRVGHLAGVQSDDPNDPYRPVGKTMGQFFASTYFFPALKENGRFTVCFPWEDEDDFRRRFLSSYAGAALEYPSQTAAEGLLREIEYLSPRSRPAGEQVYLLGYVFVVEERVKYRDEWKRAAQRLQLGGERGYGWGLVSCEDLREVSPDDESGQTCRLFDIAVTFDGRLLNGQQTRPLLRLPNEARVWAHVRAEGGPPLRGPIEPLVGREWREEGRAGAHLAYEGVCYVPGSVLQEEAAFKICQNGVWTLPAIDCKKGAPA